MLRSFVCAVIFALGIPWAAASQATFPGSTCCLVSGTSSGGTLSCISTSCLPEVTTWTVSVSVTNKSRAKMIATFEALVEGLKSSEYRRQDTDSIGLFGSSTTRVKVVGPTNAPVMESGIDKLKDFISPDELAKIKAAVRKANGE